MAFLFPAHEEDLAEIERMRARLIAIRTASNRSARQICAAAGVSPDFISRLELARRDSPKLSSVQQWAGLLNHRVEFGIENFWLHAHGGQEMLMWWAMSRPWGADAQMRQWLVSALGQWRVKMRIEVEDLAEVMGLQPGAVRDWEADTPDPMLKRAMWQARATKTRITLDVWPRAEWTRFEP